MLDEVGASVPLTGRYSVQGAQVRAGLELWAARTGAKLVLLDDASNPEQACRLHEELVRRGCRLVLGPYGSDSTRAVARAAQGRVVWNHGAAADDVQRLPGVVSVSAPASRYLVALGRAVARLRPGARVAVVRPSGRFAAFAVEGLAQQAGALGIELVGDIGDAEAVLACGPVEWEIELFHRIGTGRLLLGGLSPGLAGFPELLGDDPEGLLAPVQWHPDPCAEPELGPAIVALDDYVAAQAYATCLIAARCLELDPDLPLDAAHRLRTTTFFGGFELGAEGRQAGHRLSVVQWQDGRRQLIAPTLPSEPKRHGAGRAAPGKNRPCTRFSEVVGLWPAMREGGGVSRGPGPWGGAARLPQTESLEGRSLDVAGKKRDKPLSQTDKKTPAKPKRPKKTSRGK